ncbi:MAG: hypothetical protein LBS83_01190, partial [Holosporales bacterium]|nr:hypothetical protein [Holosporales bacterium]
MKFNINKKYFFEQLKKISSIIPNSSPNPLYEQILLDCSENQLDLYAINEIMGVKIIVDKNIEINNSGKISVSAKLLLGIVEKINDEKIL